MGDSVKIKEVLINLMSNAIKFTDFGGMINVEILKVQEHDNKTEISFSIEDKTLASYYALQFISLTQLQSTLFHQFLN